MNLSPKSNQDGFTMFEVVVSIALFVVIIMITGSMFTISQRSYTTGANESELSQNARVALDRMSRELRQSQSVVTSLSSTTPATSTEIFFQDGHDQSSITYIRYYLNGTDLMRTHEAYYFDSDPGTYVLYNSRDPFNNTTTKTILDASDNVVGEYFDSLKFWGSKKLVYITLILKKGVRSMRLDTSVYTRN